MIARFYQTAWAHAIGTETTDKFGQPGVKLSLPTPRHRIRFSTRVGLSPPEMMAVSDLAKLDDAISDDDFWDYVHGLLDATCELGLEVDHGPTCTLRVAPKRQGVDRVCMDRLNWVHARLHQTYPVHRSSLEDMCLVLVGTNAVDLVGKFMGQEEIFLRWVNPPCMSPVHMVCRVKCVDPAAVFPKKANASDVGYDITILRPHQTWGDRVTLYDTGLQIEVPHGVYAELVPRSSLSKTGYMLANSVGIIDPGYRNNLYVAVIQVDPNAKPLPLPFRGFQLIFRQHIHMLLDSLECTDANADARTVRGAGGFGSSGGAS